MSDEHRVERQLDLIFASMQRLERAFEAHEARHERIEQDRRAVERRLTVLETSTKTKWSLVVAIGSFVATVLAQVFGLRLGVQ